MVAPPGGAYVGLALPQLTEVGSIAFGRDNSETPKYYDRWQGEYTIQYTTSAMPEYAGDSEWTTIGNITYNMAEPPDFGSPQQSTPVYVRPGSSNRHSNVGPDRLQRRRGRGDLH